MFFPSISHIHMAVVTSSVTAYAVPPPSRREAFRNRNVKGSLPEGAVTKVTEGVTQNIPASVPFSSVPVSQGSAARSASAGLRVPQRQQSLLVFYRGNFNFNISKRCRIKDMLCRANKFFFNLSFYTS